MKSVDWNNVLQSGEKMVWSGKPQEVKPLNTSRKGTIILMWIIAAAWIAASLVFMVPKSLEAGDNMIHIAIMLIIIDCVPLLMLTMPFSDCKWLNADTEYAVTDRRVIVQGREKMMTMRITPDMKMELRKREGDRGHVLLGTACGKTDSGLRPAAINGVETNHVTDGLVLYGVPQAEKVMKSIASQK